MEKLDESSEISDTISILLRGPPKIRVGFKGVGVRPSRGPPPRTKIVRPARQVTLHASPMSGSRHHDTAINDAPFEMQRHVAEQEAIAQLHAPREGSPAVLADDLPRALFRDGVAAVNAVCTGPSASALLAHVNATLLAARIERDRPEGEALLGKMLCREHRYDLKLDLREVSALALALELHPISIRACSAAQAPVAAAVGELISVLGPSLASLLGPQVQR